MKAQGRSLNLSDSWEAAGGCSQLHAPAALPPGRSLCTSCALGWLGPVAGVGECGEDKISPGF